MDDRISTTQLLSDSYRMVSSWTIPVERLNIINRHVFDGFELSVVQLGWKANFMRRDELTKTSLRR